MKQQEDFLGVRKREASQFRDILMDENGNDNRGGIGCLSRLRALSLEIPDFDTQL